MKQLAWGLFGLLCVVALVTGLIENYGWWVLLAIVAVPVAGFGGWLVWMGVQPRPKQTPELRRALVGLLEAEQGMPVLEEGKCIHCGKPLVLGAKFCSYCGTTQKPEAVICRKCGTRAQDDAKFCPACGFALTEAAAKARTADAGASS